MSAPEPRRVLIASISMEWPGGGGVRYARDLALALLRHGWLPIVYTKRPGAAGEELRRATIPVTTDLSTISVPPDVIHGHHHLETLTALAHFPRVPALFVCHDGLTWHSVPPRLRRIGAYVAVDRNCRDRMTHEYGISDVRILANPIDLATFRRRGPLPPKPRRALLFSNSAAENTFGAPIRAACERRGITLDLAGVHSGNVIEAEKVLPEYDLVFGKARCALEAMAVGAAVIACDARGLAGLVTAERFDAYRQLNFGARILQRPITTEEVLAEIDRYDPADAARVTDRVRESANSDLLARQYIDLYDELLAQPVVEDDSADLAGALARMSEHLYAQQSLPPAMTLRRRLVNARALRGPVQLLYRLRNRLRSM